MCLHLETLFIIARIIENKKSEFFQIMESLKNLFWNQSSDLKIKVGE